MHREEALSCYYDAHFYRKEELDAKTIVMFALILEHCLQSGFTLGTSFCFRNGILKAKGRRAVYQVRQETMSYHRLLSKATGYSTAHLSK